VQSSQNLDIYFCTDESALNVPSLVQEGDEKSVEFLEESGNSATDRIHHRFDCVKYRFRTNPKDHCSNCFCVVCEERASDCKEWDTHCSMSKEQYKQVMALLRARTEEEEETDAGTATVAAIMIHEEEDKESDAAGSPKVAAIITHAEEDIKKLKEEKQTLEVALDDARKEILDLSNDKQFIRNLLELSESDLKGLCQAKNIELRGQGRTKRNNYIVKLLENLDG